MEKFCKNCGNKGHLYLRCTKPILSYGIILFNNNNKILLIERRNSLSYIEFIRGKYKNHMNIEYIQYLINHFTKYEKEYIIKNEFDKLWKDLWINMNTINSKIKREYKNSEILFNKLKDGFFMNDKYINLNQLICESKNEYEYEYNEWEIPKGRRENHESNRECAIREFEEETNIKFQDYQIIDNILPLIEDYISTNNVHYRHIYYIAKLITNDIEIEVNENNDNQKIEVKDIKWLNENECNQYIREYDKHKRKIIRTFYDWLNNYKEYGEIIE